MPLKAFLGIISYTYTLPGIGYSKPLRDRNISSAWTLEDQNSLVLSKELADKFFPDEDPVGKEIVGRVNNEEHIFIITGVYEDIPRNSTMRATCFINSKWTLGPINKSFKITNADLSWRHDFWITWVLLSKGGSATSLEKQFKSFETLLM